MPGRRFAMVSRGCTGVPTMDIYKRKFPEQVGAPGMEYLESLAA